jgi:hypothetical protein
MRQPLKTEKSGGEVGKEKGESFLQCCWLTVEEYVTVGVGLLGPLRK